jgi:uncharacterized protein (TIGR03437 family)
MCKLVGFFVILSFGSATISAATIGTVVPVLGQVSDLVYDSSRNLVYVANSTRNDVEVYSAATNKLTGSVQTDLTPASLAMSPDGNTLYVASIGGLSINAINLTNLQVITSYGLSSAPNAIAVGSDGMIVILLANGLLQRLDPTVPGGRIVTVPIASPPSSVVPVGTAAPLPNFIAGLATAASGNLIIGLTNSPTNRLFVYEVASGTVLSARTVSGVRAIMSMSPDGSRFMAGPFLFDSQTLAILGRAATLTPTMTGGSTFSADGNTVYANFSTQNSVSPLSSNPTPAAVLQVLRSSSLTPGIGLKLPEVITNKIIASPDGQFLFATSTSGFTSIPIGQLSNLPVLDVSTTNVVLSVDPCNRTVASATVQIRNNGSNRLTFSASSNGNSISLSTRTGIAPASLTISFAFNPSINTVFAAQQFAITLTSPDAVNVEPAILVNLNYRDVTQRGNVIPINGVAADMQMDAARQRLYIANFTQDQIEVFSLTSQTFLSPIRVGNRPRSMAIVNSSTMVVVNSGAENLSIVDLNAMAEVDQIQMGPLAVNATPNFPRSIAASSNAILFTSSPLPATKGAPPAGGFVWQLSLLTHSAFPRINLGAGTPNNPGTVLGASAMVSAGDGSAIMLVSGNLGAVPTLYLYDPIADTFPISRLPANTGITTGMRQALAAAGDGSVYVVDNTVFNSVLGPQGALVNTAIGPVGNASLALGNIISGNSVFRIQGAAAAVGPAQASNVQTLQRINLSTLLMDLSISLVEPLMDFSPSLIGTPPTTNTRLWPPPQTALELGVTGQTVLPAHGMLMDSSNNIYMLTLSGLSIVSVTPSIGRAPSFSSVVNTPSHTGALAAGGLISILGTNLADVASAGTAPLPTLLGGVCVTANEVTIPLISTSPTEIDAQLPSNLATGRVILTIRSTKLGLSSPGLSILVTATGPSLFNILVNDQPLAALFHTVDGALVTPVYPADRDETLVLYASGLGAVSPDPGIGLPGTDSPFSMATASIGVSIGGVPYEVVSTYLAPNYIGLYAIIIYVPGNRIQGSNLPVIVTSGGVSSTGNAPIASID